MSHAKMKPLAWAGVSVPEECAVANQLCAFVRGQAGIIAIVDRCILPVGEDAAPGETEWSLRRVAESVRRMWRVYSGPNVGFHEV